MTTTMPHDGAGGGAAGPEIPAPARPRHRGPAPAAGKAEGGTPDRDKAEAAAKAPTLPPRVDGRIYHRTSELLKLASEPTRIRILLLLDEGTRDVGSICGAMGIRQPTASNHLAHLRLGGLAQPRRRGKHRDYGLTEAGHRLARTVMDVMHLFD